MTTLFRRHFRAIMRRRYGLHPIDWLRLNVIGQRLDFSPARREALRTALLLVGILLAYGVAGRLDHEADLVTEASAQAARAEKMAATVADCMNGKAVFTYPDPNPPKAGLGFGRIGIFCQPAVETRL